MINNVDELGLVYYGLRDLFATQMCRLVVGYIQPLAMCVFSPIHKTRFLIDVNVPTTFRCT